MSLKFKRIQWLFVIMKKRFGEYLAKQSHEGCQYSLYTPSHRMKVRPSDDVNEMSKIPSEIRFQIKKNFYKQRLVSFNLQFM